MNIDIKHVPMVVLGFRWGMLIIALLCILEFDLPNIGLAVAVFVLAFGVAMKFARFRLWIVDLLTGKA